MKNVNEPFQKKQLKNFDASCLPPCYVELRQHLERAHFIANIWTNATLFDPYELEAENCGWILGWVLLTNSNGLRGPQLPPSVKDVLTDSETWEAEDDDIVYNSDDDIEFDDDMEMDDYSTD
ncbi:hypothetical protein NQ317_016681 [Molorchus minor]|uniref:Uncharacterized protein n=1 Tax=Molorchus minor TaxID=1323400 RepID=A0ABQ9IWN0_9CUCU|nr:hypothetical protein NQ317_016681 [Molorchus minor]